MNKIAIVFLVLVAAFAFAQDSEKRINDCNQDKINLDIARSTCISSRASYRAALEAKTKADNAYRQAQIAYDYAAATFTQAEKIEHLRASERTAAINIYNVARKVEDGFCNNLVRNVDPKTPCAKLLNRARKNNRLQQCRDSKVALQRAEVTMNERIRIFNLAFQAKEKAAIDKAAKLKIRDDANTVRLAKEGEFQFRLNNKNKNCARYRTLRGTFYGARKFDAVNGKFGYRAYKIRLSWDDAEKHCKNRRGHLISIHNDFENQLSRKLCGSGESVPIGFYRYKNGQFSWSDGSATDYTRWNVGEPNNVGTGEPFGEEYTAGGATDRWNDIHKRNFGCFVCKFRVRRN